MNKIRLATSLIAVLLLGGGYFASQYFYFFGDPATYASNLSASSVKYLALGILLVAIVLHVIPDKGVKE